MYWSGNKSVQKVHVPWSSTLCRYMYVSQLLRCCQSFLVTYLNPVSVCACGVCVCLLYVDNSQVHSSLEPKSAPCIYPTHFCLFFFSIALTSGSFWTQRPWYFLVHIYFHFISASTHECMLYFELQVKLHKWILATTAGGSVWIEYAEALGLLQFFCCFVVQSCTKYYNLSQIKIKERGVGAVGG